MTRAALFLMMVSLALPAAAQDIVVANDPNKVTLAANTPAEEAFSPHNRSLLIRLVSYGCRREAREQPAMIALSKQTGKDSAEIYCSCMGPGIMDKLTTAHVKTIIRTRKPDPALQQALVPVADRCMQLAGRK